MKRRVKERPNKTQDIGPPRWARILAERQAGRTLRAIADDEGVTHARIAQMARAAELYGRRQARAAERARIRGRDVGYAPELGPLLEPLPIQRSEPSPQFIECTRLDDERKQYLELLR